MTSSSDILKASILIVDDQEANVVMLERNAASQKTCVRGSKSSAANLSCVAEPQSNEGSPFNIQ
jgi:hypothetical protein